MGLDIFLNGPETTTTECECDCCGNQHTREYKINKGSVRMGSTPWWAQLSTAMSIGNLLLTRENENPATGEEALPLLRAGLEILKVTQQANLAPDMVLKHAVPKLQELIALCEQYPKAVVVGGY